MSTPAVASERPSPYFAADRVPLLRDIYILIFVVLVTRVLMLGVGEPDSALFATGARQWLRGGPHNLSIYSAQVCAFYYVTVTGLVRLLHIAEKDCALFMSVLSLIASVGLIIFGYLLGVRFSGPQAAFKAMLLFAVSPGLWWVSCAPHPQAVSVCFGIAAVWSFCRWLESDKIFYGAIAAACLALAIAMKIDAVLFSAAVLSVLFWFPSVWRNIVKAGVVAGLAVGLGALLPRLTMASAAKPVAAASQVVGSAARLPKLFDLLRESAPIFFGLGIVTLIAFAIAWALNRRQHDAGWRWWALLATWCLPGYAFWLSIPGNNIRHVLAFGVPLFWFGARYLRMRYVLAVVLVSMLIPANSNVIMFPSPNVPGSARLFAKKKQEVASFASAVATQSSCVVGSYTNDYIANALLDRGGIVTSEISPIDVSTASMVFPNGNVVTFTRINPRELSLDLKGCRSLEYDANGHKVRFLGNEWRLPIL